MKPALALACLAAVASAHQPAHRDPGPITQLPRFPLQRVFQGGLPRHAARVIAGGLVLNSNGRGEVTVRPVSKSGRPWYAIQHWARIDSIWQGDLDRNGVADYVIWGFAMTNGRTAPERYLTVLLFGPDGLPVPWGATQHDLLPDGFPQLVTDLDGDGVAEILVGTYDESPSHPGLAYGCSGHWTYRIFRPDGLLWKEGEGRWRDLVFPMAHAWRDRECRPAPPNQAAPVTPKRPAYRPGTEALAVKSRVTGDGRMEPVAGCNHFDAPLLYDRRGVRILVLQTGWGIGAEFDKLLARDRPSLELIGLERDVCQAALTIARLE